MLTASPVRAGVDDYDQARWSLSKFHDNDDYDDNDNDDDNDDDDTSSEARLVSTFYQTFRYEAGHVMLQICWS